MAGCSSQPQVLFSYWFEDHKVSHVAQVRPDGTFSNEVRWKDQADIFCGSVTQETGGLYRVSSFHEKRQFVGNKGGYEYNSYTNTQYLRPNELKVLISLSLQGQSRDTTMLFRNK